LKVEAKKDLQEPSLCLLYAMMKRMRMMLMSVEGREKKREKEEGLGEKNQVYLLPCLLKEYQSQEECLMSRFESSSLSMLLMIWMMMMMMEEEGKKVHREWYEEENQ